MTYTVSSETLNSSIPYYTGRGTLYDTSRAAPAELFAGLSTRSLSTR